MQECKYVFHCNIVHRHFNYWDQLSSLYNVTLKRVYTPLVTSLRTHFGSAVKIFISLHRLQIWNAFIVWPSLTSQPYSTIFNFTVFKCFVHWYYFSLSFTFTHTQGMSRSFSEIFPYMCANLCIQRYVNKVQLIDWLIPLFFTSFMNVCTHDVNA